MKKTVQKKMVVLLAAALMVGTMAGGASAFTSSHKDKFIAYGVCSTCDFATTTGSSIVIPKTNAVDTTLTNTLVTPKRTLLVDKAIVGLRTSNFTASTLAAGWSLAGYNLSGANFSRTKMSTSSAVSFAGANVSGTNFTDTEFGIADLSTIRTDGPTSSIIFVGADLRNVTKPAIWPGLPNFTNAKWKGTIVCLDVDPVTKAPMSDAGKGCYSPSTCTPAEVKTAGSGGNTGYVNNDGTCRKY